MSDHTLTPTRSHARPSKVGRVANWFRGHDDIPEDDGDGMSVTEAIQAAEARRLLAENGESPRPRVPDDEPWWGITTMDWPPAHHRAYVPDPLGFYPRAVPQPDPGPQADLGTCIIFRDTVRAVFVRQEEARGFNAPDFPWYERYAGLYRARTALPVLDFGIADAARQAHEEAKEALAADIRERIERITAPVSDETEAVAA